MTGPETPAANPSTVKRTSMKLAFAAVAAAVVMTTGGVAHAGYRWKRVAPPPTVQPANPTTTTSTTTTTSPPVSAEGYRWR